MFSEDRLQRLAMQLAHSNHYVDQNGRIPLQRCWVAGTLLTTDHRLCQFKENGSLFTGTLALELERLVDFVSESRV